MMTGMRGEGRLVWFTTEDGVVNGVLVELHALSIVDDLFYMLYLEMLE